ncbi:MAG: group III truncated hemoglobin [Chloracidobacterium sp.]|nr:group III truncated hemoglobin [Chloracidobacterium sp.]MCO5333670.1 group III truncated hemoglobin [Pyrinomonadaceae bacterium]
MKQDILNREDIDLLMREFYSRAMSDEMIGYLFTEVAMLDLEHHLPVIGDFWETLLFGTRAYQKYGRSPLYVHKLLDDKEPLTAEHFKRWVAIFDECVDKYFDGENAGSIKRRARAIAARMSYFLNPDDELRLEMAASMAF